MEYKFLSTYLDFARSIDKGNVITTVLNTDFNEKNANILLEKQKKYRASVENLITYAKDIPGITTAQKKKLNQFINRINKKASSLDNFDISASDIFCHYFSITNDRKISFVIFFKSGESWNVNFTENLRSDRLESHLYRFMHAKATKNYLVICSYPYQDKSSLACINSIKQNPTLYGSNINVVCLEEFMDELMHNIFKYTKDKISGLLRPIDPKSLLSSVNGKRGVKIEHMYASILGNSKNFELFRNNNITGPKKEQKNGSFLPNHYSLIMTRLLNDLGVNSSQVSNVTAIPIGTKGKKADVIVTITLNDNSTHPKGISIKSSSGERVSAHERHAEDFISVLGITDPTLQKAFRQFEKKGSVKNLDKKYSSALSKYYTDDNNKLELIKWAIEGEKDSPLRADYVLLHSYTYNSKKALGHAIKIYSCQQYINKLMNSNSNSSFSTPFTWTYKQNIQLKAPFFFD